MSNKPGRRSSRRTDYSDVSSVCSTTEPTRTHLAQTGSYAILGAVQLEESRRTANAYEIEHSFRSIDRPSERKRNNPYDIAPLRKVLGLEVCESDPDVLKELKNETYNYLRVSKPEARSTASY